MIKLITLEEIKAFKPLSINIDVAKQLDPWIIEAQEFDLKPILGDPFFIEIIETVEDFENILNPYKYTYNGYNYSHEGIKSSLIYWTYARYLANANQHSTPYGMVAKRNDFSENIDEKTTARLIKQAQSGAIAYMNSWITFLDRNKVLYPLWNINCNLTEKSISSTKITSIGV